MTNHSRRAILKSGFIAAASVSIPAHTVRAVSPGNSSAGKSEGTGDEAVVRKIADNILDHAQFEFTGVDNNRVYKSTEDIPENTKVGISNGFGEWHYANGVLNLAMIDLGAALNEKKYSRFVARHIAFAFDNYRYFEKPDIG